MKAETWDDLDDFMMRQQMRVTMALDAIVRRRAQQRRLRGQAVLQAMACNVVGGSIDRASFMGRRCPTLDELDRRG